MGIGADSESGPEDYAALYGFFDRARRLDGPERERVLAEAAAVSPALREELEELLRHGLRPRIALENPSFAAVVERGAAASLGASVPSPSCPEAVGAFLIRGELGRGGMGVVYRAEQEKPRREVALKVLRLEMATPDLLRRFEFEGAVLARLSHPGLADIYETGMADVAGIERPYLAMELVEGTALDAYIEAGGLDREARIRLFLEVVAAVDHAHGRGVIHRDLKPANILVRPDGRPCVLDFGLARMAEREDATYATATRDGRMLGTLGYMSPEQVLGDPRDVDLRTDVYALGVILYQILSGRLPIEVVGASVGEAALRVRDEEPPRLGELDPSLRGDLQVIAEKALRKSPDDRYGSASTLAEDLRRHLDHQPILARPPSTMYLFRKFARRHRVLVGSAFAAVLLLIGIAVAATLVAQRQTRLRKDAQTSAELATWRAYRGDIAGAAAALTDADGTRAHELLERAPAKHRGWVWSYLRSRVDQSLLVATAENVWSAMWFTPEGSSLVLFPEGPSMRPDEGDSMRRISLPDLAIEALPNPRPGRLIKNWAGPGATWLGIMSGQPSGRTPPGICDGEYRELPSSWPDVRGMWISGASLDHRYALLLRSSKTQAPEEFRYRHELRLADLRNGRYAAKFEVDSPRGSTARAVDASGASMALGTGDGRLHVYDLKARQLRQWPAHRGEITDLVYSRRTGELLSCGVDGYLRHWDPATGEEHGPGVRLPGAPRKLGLDPSGDVLAAAGHDGSVRCFDATTLAERVRWLGHGWHAHHLAVSPDGHWVASMDEDRREVRLWSTSGEEPASVLRGHRSYVYGLAFSPDGARIASGDWDGIVRLWCRRTGREILSRKVTTGVIVGLSYSPDGRLLSYESRRPNGQTTLLVDSATLEPVPRDAEPKGPRDSRTGFLTAADVFVELDGGRGSGWAVTLADPRTFAVRARIEGVGGGVSGGEGAFAVVHEDGAVRIYDPRSGRVTREFRFEEGVRPKRAELSANGRRIAVFLVEGRDSSFLRIYDVDTGRRISDLDHPWSRYQAGAAAGVPPRLVFSRDGSRLFTGSRDADVAVWDVASGERLASLPGHHDYIWGLALSADGLTLASSSGDLTVRLWDVRSRRERYREYRAMLDALARMEARIGALRATTPDPAAAVEAIRRAPDLDPLDREAALQLLTRDRR